MMMMMRLLFHIISGSLTPQLFANTSTDLCLTTLAKLGREQEGAVNNCAGPWCRDFRPSGKSEHYCITYLALLFYLHSPPEVLNIVAGPRKRLVAGVT